MQNLEVEEQHTRGLLVGQRAARERRAQHVPRRDGPGGLEQRPGAGEECPQRHPHARKRRVERGRLHHRQRPAAPAPAVGLGSAVARERRGGGAHVIWRATWVGLKMRAAADTPRTSAKPVSHALSASTALTSHLGAAPGACERSGRANASRSASSVARSPRGGAGASKSGGSDAATKASAARRSTPASAIAPRAAVSSAPSAASAAASYARVPPQCASDAAPPAPAPSSAASAAPGAPSAHARSSAASAPPSPATALASSAARGAPAPGA